MDTAPSHRHAYASPTAGRGGLRGPLLAALATLVAGCAAGRVVDGAYANPAAGFRVPVPPAPWAAVALPDVDIAFRHPSAGTIAVFSACDGAERGPLRAVARHLFFGLKNLEVVDQAPVALDGAEALRTVARGLQDGRPVIVESVVVRRATCVADLALAAPPEEYPALRPDFDRVVAGWRPLAPAP